MSEFSTLLMGRSPLNSQFLADEGITVGKLLDTLPDYPHDEIQHSARQLVEQVRGSKNKLSLSNAFLQEYGLNSEEGLILMSLAEALLRIPDRRIQDLFLQEKLSSGDWAKHHEKSGSKWVNLATDALNLTRKLELEIAAGGEFPEKLLRNQLAALTSPAIRSTTRMAMQLLAQRFVLAESIEEAVKISRLVPGSLHSFDMLGEAALTANESELYFQAYRSAISALSEPESDKPLYSRPNISVKLSALFPRYEPLQHQQAIPLLSARLLTLAKEAKLGHLTLTIDAEESDRLELSLTVFSNVYADSSL